MSTYRKNDASYQVIISKSVEGLPTLFYSKRHYHDQARLAARAPELARHLAEAGQQASRQAAARAQATALGPTFAGATPASAVIPGQRQREDAHRQLLEDQEHAALGAAQITHDELIHLRPREG